jgi:hypothetical protein
MEIAQNLQNIQSGAGLGSVPIDQGVGGIISNAFEIVFYLSGFLLLIYMIMGGFQLMFAKGGPKAVSGGWAKVTNALIGFIIIVFAYAITSILGKVFGITVFGQLFK